MVFQLKSRNSKKMLGYGKVLGRFVLSVSILGKLFVFEFNTVLGNVGARENQI